MNKYMFVRRPKKSERTQDQQRLKQQKIGFTQKGYNQLQQ